MLIHYEPVLQSSFSTTAWSGPKSDRVTGTPEPPSEKLTLSCVAMPGGGVDRILSDGVTPEGQSVKLFPVIVTGGVFQYDLSGENNPSVAWVAHVDVKNTELETVDTYYFSTTPGVGDDAVIVEDFAWTMITVNAEYSKDGTEIVLSLRADDRALDNLAQRQTMLGFAQAINFEVTAPEIDGVLTVPHDADFVPVGNFRVDLIVNIRNVVAAPAIVLIMKGVDLLAASGEWTLYVSGAGKWRFVVVDLVGSPIVCDSIIPAATGLHHITAFWDGSALRMVLDGEEIGGPPGATVTTPVPFTNPYVGKVGDLSFAKRVPGPLYPMDGEVWAARVYNGYATFPTLAAIIGETLKFASNTTYEPALVAEWKITEAVGTVVGNSAKIGSHDASLSNPSGPWDPWIYTGTGAEDSAGRRYPMPMGLTSLEPVWGDRNSTTPRAHVGGYRDEFGFTPPQVVGIDWVRSGGQELFVKRPPLFATDHPIEWFPGGPDGYGFIRSNNGEVGLSTVPPFTWAATGSDIVLTGTAIDGTYRVGRVERDSDTWYGRVIYMDASTPILSTGSAAAATIDNTPGGWDVELLPDNILQFDSLPSGKVLARVFTSGAFPDDPVPPPANPYPILDVRSAISALLSTSGISWPLSNQAEIAAEYGGVPVGLLLDDATIREGMDQIVLGLGAGYSYTSGIGDFDISEITIPEPGDPTEYDFTPENASDIELVRTIPPYPAWDVHYRHGQAYSEGDLLAGVLSTLGHAELAAITEPYRSTSSSLPDGEVEPSGLSQERQVLWSSVVTRSSASDAATRSAQLFRTTRYVISLVTGIEASGVLRPRRSAVSVRSPNIPLTINPRPGRVLSVGVDGAETTVYVLC